MVISPSSNHCYQNAGIAGAFAYADNLLAAAPVGLLGLLLLFQVSPIVFFF
jgi:hypothetical protein